MNNKTAIDTLNDLIETARDGQEGFSEAADNVQAADLKTLFRETSQERGRLVRELQQIVRSLGGEPEQSGSTAGALQRAWLNIKGSLMGKDDASILAECERGEDSAVDAYSDALKKGLPSNIMPTVEMQYNKVKQVHDRVKQLRDSRSATAGRR